METESHKEHRRSKTDPFMGYSFGSMSQDFLGSRNVLSGTFDELDEIDGKLGLESTGRDDIEPTLVGNKHLRSMSFMDSRDLHDHEGENEIFIMNANVNGPSELDSGVGVGRHMGHMSPPQGTLRPKKTVRASRPMSSATSTQGGHRRIKSMSSASTDQMMLDYFRRDPNVALHELPDLGSMSMESAGMFTSEDWQEAFIQIGTENDLGAGGEGAPGVHMGHRKSADSSSFGISLPQSYSPSKDISIHMLPPHVPLDKSGGGGIGAGTQQHQGVVSASRSNSGDSNSSSVFREFQQRQGTAATCATLTPDTDLALHDNNSQFLHTQVQQSHVPSATLDSTTRDNPLGHGVNFNFTLPTGGGVTAALPLGGSRTSNNTGEPAKKGQGHRHSHTTNGSRPVNTVGEEARAQSVQGSGKVTHNQSLLSHRHPGRGISDPEYHKSSKGPKMTDDYLEMDKKSSNRGKYRCGRCGQPKVNHQCPYEIETSTRSISAQVEYAAYDEVSHPFTTEKTLVVKRRTIFEGTSAGAVGEADGDVSGHGQSAKISHLIMHPSRTAGVALTSEELQVMTQKQSQIQSQMQQINAPSVSVYSREDNALGSSSPNKTSFSSSQPKKTSPSSSLQTSKKAPSPQSANFTRSSSSDTSMYNEILKDLRIVHPSLRGKVQQPSPLPTPQHHHHQQIKELPQEEGHSVATVSTDESDSNSLFLSSLSSNSSSTD